MRPSRSAPLAFAAFAALAPGTIRASDIVEVLPLTDRILMLHFDDGHVVHHQVHQKRSNETVVVDPLDIGEATRPAAYNVTSPDDKAYAVDRIPRRVWRKSKGTDFAWFCDTWVDEHCVNERPDHAKEHWVYLALPEPMKTGHTYHLTTGWLAKNGSRWTVAFDETKTRSEAVHVNLLGYVPSAPRKYAYVYHWMGDGGPLDLAPRVGRECRLVDRASGEVAHTSRLTFRRPRTNPETEHLSDSPPRGNFVGADVYECDFSSFSTAGEYVMAVQGIGASFPFSIHPDVYREAFRAVARGLYHNRSGIALERPWTEFERPAPHNPSLTPGFEGKLVYTTSRFVDRKDQDRAEEDRAAIERGIQGPLEAWGWYQDAGDWDGYYAHLRVAQELLLAYQMAPGHFTDGELGIPESGNGVPDILDEAAWLPRFYHRLRHELVKKGWGSGGVGSRVTGDHFGTAGDGVPSWEDTGRLWTVSGEDPWSTYRYAGAAAQLALTLQIAGAKDPEDVDWEKEARESYAWARAHTRPGDEAGQPRSTPEPLRLPRAYAAAALFRLTGDASYEGQLREDTAGLTMDDDPGYGKLYGPFVHVLGGKGTPDPALLERLRALVLHAADKIAIDSSVRRGLRWGGVWSFPMLVGHQTTPWVLEGAVAMAITRESDPGRSRAYRATLYTTADYFLGTNALNTTWVTGLGPRHPVHVFHQDAWYNGTGRFHEGLIPYGPWRKETDLPQGPWDKAWPHFTVHPEIDAWPGNERWFDNRCAPLSSEFTVHQNLGPAAALFGLLTGEAEGSGPGR